MRMRDSPRPLPSASVRFRLLPSASVRFRLPRVKPGRGIPESPHRVGPTLSRHLSDIANGVALHPTVTSSFIYARMGRMGRKGCKDGMQGWEGWEGRDARMGRKGSFLLIIDGAFVAPSISRNDELTLASPSIPRRTINRYDSIPC